MDLKVGSATIYTRKHGTTWQKISLKHFLDHNLFFITILPSYYHNYEEFIVSSMLFPGNLNYPVLSFEKYVSKLNTNKDDLLQRLGDFFSPDDDVCYANAPGGEKFIA